MHPLAAAVGPMHLGDQQFAPEQVVDGQRGRPALPAGRIGLGPVIRIDGITGIECQAARTAASRSCGTTLNTRMILPLPEPSEQHHHHADNEP